MAKDVVQKIAYFHGLNPPAPRSIHHFWHKISTFLSIIRRAQLTNKLAKHLPQQQVFNSKNVEKCV